LVADLPLIDAAIKTGLSCEFLTDATARAMKYKHTRKLKGAMNSITAARVARGGRRPWNG
jgi:hypothetical protein